MPIVDSRGRVFGRINLIDFFVAVFAVVLVPLAYGGYLLFRIPPPRIISVSPTTVPFTTNTEQRLEITAEHLRPYLRAKIGTNSARSFEADSASHGEVKFGDLPVGVHDLILYDESQEIARLPNALTIEPAPLQLVGTLSASSDALRPGVAFGPPDRPIAELLRVDEGSGPEKRRAVVRVKCQLAARGECNVGGVRVRAGASLELSTASGQRTTFAVDELRVDANWVEIAVRLMAFPESVPLIRPGDIDGDDADSTPAAAGAEVASSAIVVSVGEVRKSQGVFAFNAPQPPPRPNTMHVSAGVAGNITVDAVDARMIVPLRPGEADRYHDVPVRPGSVFPFETRKYQAQVLVVSIAGEQ